MINIICKNCKQKVEVPMYFYDARITTHDSHMVREKDEYYRAIVNGKAICPKCGTEIRETFYSEISDKDIIKIAARRVDYCESQKGNRMKVSYRVIYKKTGEDITHKEDWVLLPDGRLVYLTYDDMLEDPSARAVFTIEEEED